MSAYTQQETAITDVESLKKSLAEKGYKEVECHDTAQPLIGYHGDKRKDTAEIIIRRKHIGGASNDIGFKKQANGTYTAIISDYDKGKHNTTWLADLKKNYAEDKICKVAKQNGLTLLKKEVITATGSVKYQFLSA